MAGNPRGIEALSQWHDVLAAGLRAREPELTIRQLAILLHIYVAPPPHTVRGLAAEFGLAKPAVTRALDRLSGLDLVRRKKDETDKRSILVQRTVKGAVYMSEFAERVTSVGSDAAGPDMEGTD